MLQVPVQYNHLLQGLIYTNLDRALSEWLHEKGHAYGERRFKLFTFSRLFGRREAKNDRVRFDGPIHFYLGAVSSDVLGSFAEHLLTRPTVRLGSTKCRVSEVGVEPEPDVDSNKPVIVKAFSPITAYSTLMTPDVRKKAYYCAPQEGEWSESLVSNVARKAKALEWSTDVQEDLEGAYVKPHKVSKTDQQVRLSTAEVMCSALVAAAFFGANIEKARSFLDEYAYLINKAISKSRFNRRLLMP